MQLYVDFLFKAALYFKVLFCLVHVQGSLTHQISNKNVLFC